MTGLIWASFCVVVITFQVVCLFVFIFLLSHLYLKLSVSPGFFAIVVSSLAVAAVVYYGVDLTYIHSNFLQLASASFLISVLLSVYLYVRSRYAAPAQLALGGNSGKGKDLQLPPSWSDTFCSASLVNSLNLNVFFSSLWFLQAMWFMTFSKDVSSILASKTLTWNSFVRCALVWLAGWVVLRHQTKYLSQKSTPWTLEV